MKLDLTVGLVLIILTSLVGMIFLTALGRPVPAELPEVLLLCIGVLVPNPQKPGPPG